MIASQNTIYNMSNILYTEHMIQKKVFILHAFYITKCPTAGKSSLTCHFITHSSLVIGYKLFPSASFKTFPYIVP